MTRESFIKNVESLTGSHMDIEIRGKAVVSADAAYSGKTETFDYSVFKRYKRNGKGGLLIQYSELGSKGQRPKLPGLKSEVAKKLAEEMGNSVTYLTSGQENCDDRDGMRDVATLLRCISILKKYGINLEL